MKTLYTLKTIICNGTVTMQTVVDNFVDKSLAEETMNAVRNANNESDVYCVIEETNLYESRDEVPILKGIPRYNYLGKKNTYIDLLTVPTKNVGDVYSVAGRLYTFDGKEWRLLYCDE